jgi:heat shock protein HtpX
MLFKRIGLFLIVNVAVMATVGFIVNFFGITPYINAYGINYQSLLIMCLLWGMVGSFISLSISRWTAKTMMGVKLQEPNGPYGALVSKVHAFARKAGFEKMPEVGVYMSPEVNAFATGPSKNKSLVAVSSGLLENMTEDEVDGVLAHEVAHIQNGDMVTMALVQGVVNAFVMFFSRIAAFAVSQALRGDDDEGPGLGGLAHFGLVMLFDIIFGLLATPIVAGFSRWREYRADSGGAYLAGKHKMIAALERLQQKHEYVDTKSNPEMAAFKISNRAGLMALLSTHPPLDKRIAALRRS